MSILLNRVLGLGLLLGSPLLCSIRPDDEPGGGGGAAPASAPTEPLRPEAAPSQPGPAVTPEPHSASPETERNWHIHLFATGGPDEPELHIRVNDAFAQGLDGLGRSFGQAAARLLLGGRVGPDRGCAHFPPPPPPAPSPVELQALAKEQARRWVVQQAAQSITAEAARLRAEAVLAASPEKAQAADELETRLAALLASVPPLYQGTVLVPATV
ncbi:MAG: hypothetical protein U1A78_39985 [Polyangia bacterium]